MAADRSRVLKRVTELLNLSEPGEYSATLNARNKTRNASAIEDFVDEAGMMILTQIARIPNEFRQAFVADSAELTDSGNLLPTHLGPPAGVRILPYGDAPYWMEGARKDYKTIQSYRENPHQVYDMVDHDQSTDTMTGEVFTVYSSNAVNAYAETPSPVPDGVQTVFTISQSPLDDIVMLAVNGVVRTQGIDFNVFGTQITMLFTPGVGDELYASYLVGGEMSSVVVPDAPENGGSLRRSALAGYYDIWEDRFFFTGAKAVVRLARAPVRADTALLVPEIFENTWIRLAVGEAAKVGIGTAEAAVIGEYYKRGLTDLQEFANGRRQYAEVDEPRPPSAVHVVS